MEVAKVTWCFVIDFWKMSEPHSLQEKLVVKKLDNLPHGKITLDLSMLSPVTLVSGDTEEPRTRRSVSSRGSIALLFLDGIVLSTDTDTGIDFGVGVDFNARVLKLASSLVCFQWAWLHASILDPLFFGLMLHLRNNFALKIL
jgi:hypothetical protein